MIKVKYENDGALLRIGSRKNFRISSRKIETVRKRRKLDMDLEPGEVFGFIPEDVPEPGPPPDGEPPIQDDPPISSRTAINNEQ